MAGLQAQPTLFPYYYETDMERGGKIRNSEAIVAWPVDKHSQTSSHTITRPIWRWMEKLGTVRL